MPWGPPYVHALMAVTVAHLNTTSQASPLLAITIRRTERRQ
ncbi:hypothetical protein BIFGAL_03845 [Bifidobacterium gallicum DSM 20093 = LMG 11596]|uniref:Uncharacterized protein n=1 Tax=Bifidobacterium gallicum DSM 20093 = LMG 11596 TaxID=561180 RepID=D1NVG0_9BIFI|nr:hypothetical protein BIFGAL_03845 [Bifidobacterium gallicum DSM 20093 = LMG 11596]